MVPAPIGVLHIDVFNHDFDHQGGILVVSHEPTAVTLRRIVINASPDINCIFGDGTEMAFWSPTMIGTNYLYS